MRLIILAAAMASAIPFAATAQTTTIIQESNPPPAVVIEREAPSTSVTVEKERGLLGDKKTTVETTGSDGCSSKTVRKEGIVGSKTVKRTDC